MGLTNIGRRDWCVWNVGARTRSASIYLHHSPPATIPSVSHSRAKWSVRVYVICLQSYVWVLCMCVKPIFSSIHALLPRPRTENPYCHVFPRLWVSYREGRRHRREGDSKCLGCFGWRWLIGDNIYGTIVGSLCIYIYIRSFLRDDPSLQPATRHHPSVHPILPVQKKGEYINFIGGFFSFVCTQCTVYTTTWTKTTMTAGKKINIVRLCENVIWIKNVRVTLYRNNRIRGVIRT